MAIDFNAVRNANLQGKTYKSTSNFDWDAIRKANNVQPAPAEIKETPKKETKKGPSVTPTSVLNSAYENLSAVKTAKENDIPLEKKSTGLDTIATGNVIGGLGQLGMETLRAPQSLLLNAARNAVDLTRGNGLSWTPNYSYAQYAKDVAPESKLTKTIESDTFVGDLLENSLEMASDPLTYFGGGIVDDLAKTGRIGKASQLGTTENLIQRAKTSENVLSKLPKAADNVTQFDKGTYDVLDTIDDTDGTFQYIKNKNTGREQFVKTAAKQPDEARYAAESIPKARTTVKPKDGDIPKSSTVERGFSRNTRTDVNNPDDLRQAFEDNPLTYEQVSNKDTLSKANDIYKKGYSTARTQVTELASQMRPESVPLAKMLARDATNAGNVQEAREILSEVADRLTEAGQFSQAARLLRESDPETFLMTIDKQLRKLNEQGALKYGKKWKNVDLLPNEIDAIKGIKPGDNATYENIWEQIGRRIADEMPSKGIEKFNAWRRMAMLLNPRTHIRNLGGNTIMRGLRKTADAVGATFEKTFLPQAQRTKSIGWSADEGLRNVVNASWDNVKKDITGSSGRWDFQTILGREKRIFKNNILEKINKASGSSLNAEDVWFIEPAYKDALGQFMKARGIKEATEEGIQYATRRALEATYRDASWMADIINKAKSKGGALGTITEAAIPFTKTSINIAKRAYEYSPAGLVGDIIENIVKRKDPVKFIERLSQGLTGSAITALGYGLAKMGLISGQPEKSYKYEKFKQTSGELPYSVTIGGKDYSYDWAQPFSVPLAMGVEIYDSIKEDKDLLEAVTDAIMTGGDTIFNMSVLQNVRDAFAGYSTPTEAIADLGVDYAKQAVPTVLRQASRVADPTIRSTYDPNELKSLGRYALSAVPGASSLLEPKVDVWGREVTQGGLGERVVNNLAAPWLTSNAEPTKVDKELSRLFEQTNDTDIFPKVVPYSTSKVIDGKKVIYRLQPEELTRIQKEVGQDAFQRVNKEINSSIYNRLSDQEKQKKIEKAINKSWEIWEDFRLTRLEEQASK